MRGMIIIAIFLGMLIVNLPGTLRHPHGTFIGQKASADKMVDIGGYKLYINCTGNVVKNTPTIVMEAGLNSSSETWSLIQPELAKFTRACIYDRAGTGKSDPPLQQPRTSSQIARDLHTLLTKARITGPIILVGHSFGGIIVRMYASLYPQKVVGMVLVDSVHEEETAKWLALIPPEIKREMEQAGGKRLLGGEQIDLQESNREMKAANWHTDIPLIVLSRGKSSYNPDDYPPQLRSFAPKGEELRIRLQQELASRSSRSKHIFAEKSGHMIQHDQPKLVIDAIRQVVEATRLKDRKEF